MTQEQPSQENLLERLIHDYMLAYKTLGEGGTVEIALDGSKFSESLAQTVIRNLSRRYELTILRTEDSIFLEKKREYDA